MSRWWPVYRAPERALDGSERRTFSKRVTSERACLSFQQVDPGMLVSRPQVSGRDETSHGVLGWYTDTIPRRVCQDLSPNTEIVVRRSLRRSPFISVRTNQFERESEGVSTAPKNSSYVRQFDLLYWLQRSQLSEIIKSRLRYSTKMFYFTVDWRSKVP